MRPRASKVTDAHTPSRKVERFSICRPSGPGPWWTSDWYASTWRFERPLGAMNGCRGGAGTAAGGAAAGGPGDCGSGAAAGPPGGGRGGGARGGGARPRGGGGGGGGGG